jgi:Fuc2NAc and GlcNAc transferase
MVQALGPVTFGLTIAALSVSAGGVWFSIRLARKAGFLDVPNDRSSHTIPTPRLGGVPMVVSAILPFAVWVFLAAGEGFSFEGVAGTVLFAFGMSALGFYDDLFDLSPLIRIVIQFALCLSCLGFFRSLFPGLLWVGVASVWCVWMLNLYNFMDGIDGLAGGEAAVASSFFFLLFARSGEPGWAVANLMVAASAAGFLVHNWPPAKVFMGDSGSAFLGAFYGMQSLIAPVTTGIPFIVLVLPFSNFILDATVTLFLRIYRGEKWYLAHRSHIYQRMTDLGMSHRKVATLELIVVAVSCVAAEAYLRAGDLGRMVILTVVFGGLAFAGVRVQRKESALSG